MLKPLGASSLAKEEKAGSLQVLNFLKENCDATLKGQTCVDGRSQQSYINKEELASPTCLNDVLIFVLIQTAHEGRKTHTMDVCGVYLHAEMDDLMVIKLQGQIVDILFKMKPENKKFMV